MNDLPATDLAAVKDSLIHPAILALAIVAVLVTVGLAITIYAYSRRRMDAAVGDAQDAAELAAWRDRVSAEVMQMRTWLSETREELLQLDAEREAQERLRRELAELEMSLASAADKLEGERRESLELQHAVGALSNDRDRLQTEIQSLKAAAPEYTERARQLRSELDDLIAQKDATLRELQELVERKSARQREIDDLKAERDRLSSERSQLGASVQDLSSQRDIARTEIERIGTELQTKRSNLAEVDNLQEKTREKLRLEREIDVLAKELDALRSESTDLDEAHQARLDSIRYADLLEVVPDCLAADVLSGHPTSANGKAPDELEIESLERVAGHLKNQSLFFPERVVHAFHTCIKVGRLSPLTVLAGVSGTGKSELPLRYAEAMGMYRLALPVQPSWSSPQDLFGFYNYLEKRYKATDLARALVRMDAFNFPESRFPEVASQARTDAVLMVLLDEMNLARIEYYFSEFLSRLEARRAVSDDSDWSQRMAAEIEIEGPQAGQSEKRGRSLRVWVGDNVLFTGTMNEDESTQTLSDKVLDRANVLRFGRPPDLKKRIASDTRSNDLVSSNFLSRDTWSSWKRPVPASADWRRDVDGWIERLNEGLGGLGRPFGWRVKRAILDYVANYPGIAARDAYRTAMADQVEQKILPKLRGIDVSSPRAIEALDTVQSILDELRDDDLREAVDHCRAEASSGPFDWRGVTRSI